MKTGRQARYAPITIQSPSPIQQEAYGRPVSAQLRNRVSGLQRGPEARNSAAAQYYSIRPILTRHTVQDTVVGGWVSIGWRRALLSETHPYPTSAQRSEIAILSIGPHRLRGYSTQHAGVLALGVGGRAGAPFSRALLRLGASQQLRGS